MVGPARLIVGEYGESIAKVLPDAAQVADRWHLMGSSSRGFLDAVGKQMAEDRPLDLEF